MSIHWPYYSSVSMFMLSFTDPTILLCPCLCCHSLTLLFFCVHVYVVIHFWDSVWSFWVEDNPNIFFLIVCLYPTLYCHWRSNFRERLVAITLTLPLLCACLNLGPGFSMSYVKVFFVSNCLKWEVVVRFVDSGDIVDHHCCLCF